MFDSMLVTYNGKINDDKLIYGLKGWLSHIENFLMERLIVKIKNLNAGCHKVKVMFEGGRREVWWHYPKF